MIGGGPAGVATIDSLMANSQPGEWQVTLVGREPGLPYNRVALSDHLAGDKSASSLALRDRRWYEQRGIELWTGDEVAAIDGARRVATTRGGRALHYDALVLATGSQPLLPPIEGLDRDGVFAFRTREDVRAILAAGRSARHVVVLGGGLLGLEAARGLARHGLKVTVVHLSTA